MALTWTPSDALPEMLRATGLNGGKYSIIPRPCRGAQRYVLRYTGKPSNKTIGTSYLTAASAQTAAEFHEKYQAVNA